MPAKKKLSSRWLKFSADDLKAAELAFGENLHNIVCFHSQQAVEKSLKALYLLNFDTVPKTHDLETIAQKLEDKLPQISSYKEKVRFLNKFYVPTRYPDTLPGSLPEGLPDKTDANQSIEFAKEITDFVRENLKS